MLDKKSHGVRVYEVAVKNKIPQTVVKAIINRFFQLCREDLINGKEVYLFRFVRLVPNLIKDEYVNTIARYCSMVADMEGVTYFTVSEVMQEYFEGCRKDLMEGRPVVFRALATIRPQLDANGVVESIHVSKAAVLKQDIIKKNTGVTAVRAYVCKFIKDYVQRGEGRGEVVFDRSNS